MPGGNESEERTLLERIAVGMLSEGMSNTVSDLGQTYTHYAVITLPPQVQPQDLTEAARTIDIDFQRIASMREDFDSQTLVFVLGGELSRNGVREVDGSITTGAWNPLPKEFYEAMVWRSRDLSATLPPNWVVSHGTVAVDTGEKAPDGRPIGENRSWAILSSGTQAVEMTKKYASTIDGWDTDEYAVLEGEGAKRVIVPGRLANGREIVATFVVCLDIHEQAAELAASFPTDPNLLLVSAAGMPSHLPFNGTTQLILNDSNFNTFHRTISERDDGFVTGVMAPGYFASELLGNSTKRVLSPDDEATYNLLYFAANAASAPADRMAETERFYTERELAREVFVTTEVSNETDRLMAFGPFEFGVSDSESDSQEESLLFGGRKEVSSSTFEVEKRRREGNGKDEQSEDERERDPKRRAGERGLR